MNREKLERKGLVFHGMNSKHVPFDGILKAREPDMTYYRRYKELLDRPQIFLGNSEECGLDNPDYDIYFAFDIYLLRKNNPEIRYIDSEVWFMLAFHKDIDVSSLDPLFKNDFDNGKCEVIMDVLDLNLCEYIFYSSKQALDTARRFDRPRYLLKKKFFKIYSSPLQVKINS